MGWTEVAQDRIQITGTVLHLLFSQKQGIPQSAAYQLCMEDCAPQIFLL
jgi:hypothetical protein